MNPSGPSRNLAVDNYRGFVMLLMMAEVLRLSAVAKALPDSAIWQFLAYHQSHVEWAGCSLHDLIQPSFSFLVGVALPYSIASRLAKGGDKRKMWLHALWRAFLLAALGIFLRSTHRSQTNFTFEDTLTQIGLGYPFLFALGFCSIRVQWTAFAAIMGGYWAMWAAFPLNEAAAPYTGFLAHWNKNANFGSNFDLWFLNLFPREKPFVANGGGYLTLSFIPTLATMILGLAAGRWLRESAPRIPYRKLLWAGLIGFVCGLILHFLGICPVVKRIWTPAWVFFSGGGCFLLLAAFCRIQGKWMFPLTVIGLNSIAAYLIAHLFEDFIRQSFVIHLGRGPFQAFGLPFEPFLLGTAVLVSYWFILFWMYRRKLFLRI